MKQFSFWASSHKWQSWIIIIFLHFLTTFLAIFLGNALFFEGYTLSMNWVIMFIVLALASLLLYPIQGFKSGIFKPTYLKRKSYETLVMFSGCMIILIMSNSLTSTTISEHTSQNTPQALRTILIPHNQKLSTKAKIKNWFKQKNKKFTKRFTKFWDKQNNKKKVLYLLLAVLLGMVAMGIVGLLACSLSCSGAEALGGIVGLLGVATVIALFIVVVRKILKTNYT